MKTSEHKSIAVPAANRRSDDVLRRKCACASNGGHCDSCGKSGTAVRSGALGRPAAVPSIVHDVLSSPGQQLDDTTRAFMEPRFGRDFSHVRVHADSRAAESAGAVNARAYTVGRNVVFGAAQYSPGTSEGRRLLAHELTHVAQQQTPVSHSTALSIGPADDAHERAADQQTERAVAGTGVFRPLGSAASHVLRRSPFNVPKDDLKKNQPVKEGPVEEKKVITQPPPQEFKGPQITRRHTPASKEHAGEDGIQREFSFGPGFELGLSREGVEPELGMLYKLEYRVPLNKKKYGHLSIVPELGLSHSVGMQGPLGERPQAFIQPEVFVKPFVAEYEKAKPGLGIFGLGLSSTVLSRWTVDPVSGAVIAKFGAGGEISGTYRPFESAPWFLKLSAGIEVLRTKEGGAFYKYSPWHWHVGAAFGLNLGIEF